MSDRLTRKELKEDTLVKETARAADFLAHHGRALLGGVVVVVVVAAGVFFMRNATSRGSEAAAELLAKADIAFQTNNYDAAAASLDDLVSKYGGTPSGKRGQLLFGDVRFAQMRYDDALASYEKAANALKGGSFAAAAARRGLAACYENLGRYQDAAAAYHTLSETAPNAVVKAELLMAEARSLSAAGQTDAAKSLLGQLGDDQDNLRVAFEAKLLLAEMQYR